MLWSAVHSAQGKGKVHYQTTPQNGLTHSECGAIHHQPELGGSGPQCSNGCWLNRLSVYAYNWTNLVVCALPRSSSLHTCLATTSGPQDKLLLSGRRFAPHSPNTSVNGNNAESRLDVYIQWPQVGVLSKWRLRYKWSSIHNSQEWFVHKMCIVKYGYGLSSYMHVQWTMYAYLQFSYSRCPSSSSQSSTHNPHTLTLHQSHSPPHPTPPVPQ